MSKLLSGLLKHLIVSYQWLIKPWLGNRCRFEPSCSNYAIEALTVHGPILGTYFSIKRLCKCAPWSCGGHDPVPQKKQ
ncbi:MAG: membrane protein insertion efficiency factor YidD [Betaproteobacteria bacterium]